MPTAKRDFPFVYPTWITGLLSGVKQCRYAAWYKAQHTYDKRPDPTFNSADYNARHAQLVTRRKKELEAEGIKTKVMK